MNSKVIDFLQKKGYKIPDTSMYNFINMWKKYYEDELPYKSYRDSFGKEREMYTAGMAKRVAEDWSSIIHTENDEIVTDKPQNKKFVGNFVAGMELDSQLGEIIEKAAWSGTVASVIRLNNLKIEKGMLVPGENTEYEIITVGADQIIPLKIKHGKIIDLAIVSQEVANNKIIVYIELHELTKDHGYKISNIYVDGETGTEIEKEGIVKEFYTGENTPLFSILKTPVVNNIENNIGLGLSVFANALKAVQSTDIIYHNFNMDFVLGGKKIIYNEDLIQYKTVTVVNPDGTKSTRDVPVYPDDISKQQFMKVGNNLSQNDETLIHEYNPELRVQENVDGMQFALDFLSFKCGLGTRYYEFKGGTIVTATQYLGDRQDLAKNAHKFRKNLKKYISGIIKAALLLGRLVYKAPVTEDCNVDIANEDGILVSDEEVKENLRQELQMGLISKTTYLMKINKWDEKRAKEELARIQEENSITEVKLEE